MTAVSNRNEVETPLTESYWPAVAESPVEDLTVGGLLRRAVDKAPESDRLGWGVHFCLGATRTTV